MRHRILLCARRASAWGLCLLLVACTSTALRPLAVDSPLPSDLARTLADSCLNKKQLKAPGEWCWLIVQAAIDPLRSQEKPTGLTLNASEVYRMQADPPHPFWYDATRQVAAPEGDKGSGFMKALGFMKIHPQEKWLALMASMTSPAPVQPHALTTTDGLYQAPANGQLLLYVNDAPGFYSNNQGRVRVTITRITPRASPHTAHTASGSPP